MTVVLELQPELLEVVALGNHLDLVVVLGNRLGLAVVQGNPLVLDIQQKQLVAQGNQFDLDILLDLVLDIHLAVCLQKEEMSQYLVIYIPRAAKIQLDYLSAFLPFKSFFNCFIMIFFVLH